MAKPKKISLPELIEKCQKDSGCNDWAEIGIIQADLRNLLIQKTGAELFGYRLVVEGSALIHTIKRHGIASNDRTPIDFTDFFCLTEIINKPDNIKRGGLKKSTSNNSLVFEKTIGHTYYCVEEIRCGSKKGDRISFVSLRKRLIIQKPLK